MARVSCIDCGLEESCPGFDECPYLRISDLKRQLAECRAKLDETERLYADALEQWKDDMVELRRVKAEVPCPDCGGSGLKIGYPCECIDYRDEGLFARVDCQKCNGEGVPPCESCNGTSKKYKKDDTK